MEDETGCPILFVPPEVSPAAAAAPLTNPNKSRRLWCPRWTTPVTTTEKKTPTIAVRVCPECSGPLTRASGCVACQRCGWSKCG
jgi:hypothetical protein